jgi:exopolysaccharide biosynthesis polyprenyl glycosylphosphotransferase
MKLKKNPLNPMKRVFEVLISLVIIVLLSPLLLILFLIIPLSSKGSALYKQERVGRDGLIFSIYKFRSMIEHAEKESGPVLSSDKDPRVTWIGKFLRRSRIDELPQLWNVIKGEMSLVGPRPERPCFVEHYEKTIPNYPIRHFVRPGLTGLAQVKGSYSTPTEIKLSYDLQYIYSYSFFLDMKILFFTVKVILQQERLEELRAKETKAVDPSTFRETL